MIFAEIHDLEISDACKNRYGTTFANVRVDNVTIYGAQILSREEACSGQNTVGAFENSDKHSLVAWIDPISENFLSLRPDWLSSPLGVLVLTALIGGLCMAAVNLFLIFLGTAIRPSFTFIPTVAFSGACIGLIVACIKSVPKISDLETQLRSELKNVKSQGIRS
jgi:hypothetical protein